MNAFSILKHLIIFRDSYWKKKQEENKAKRAEEKAAKQAKKNEEKSKRKEKEDRAGSVTVIKGLVLNVSNLPTDTTIDGLKTFFKKFGDVGFVVYEKGQTEVSGEGI